MIPGIFVGYHFHSGSRWSGDYLVLDSEAYQTSIDGANLPVHRTREIHLGKTLRFPVKDGHIEFLPEEARGQTALGRPRVNSGSAGAYCLGP